MNLRPSQAARELGVGLTKLWALVKNEPDFPAPIKLGPRTTVFRREDLNAWMDRRVAAATSALKSATTPAPVRANAATGVVGTLAETASADTDPKGGVR
jgi:prophage regulatory protein